MKLHMVFLVVDDGFGNIWRTMNNQNTRDSIMMILKRKMEINWMVLIGLILGGGAFHWILGLQKVALQEIFQMIKYYYSVI